ncbi:MULTISPECIES: D-Ala-D-Ala carboxypeptidase family metallohydrolase [unclassified Moraxella]|uniref:D-Ala-D-Ala carboxypeptidase family metallohydrolase n=1 Tax=unclassified Moraxella TaxID=2685852 RepID=UPI00359E0801
MILDINNQHKKLPSWAVVLGVCTAFGLSACAGTPLESNPQTIKVVKKYTQIPSSKPILSQPSTEPRTLLVINHDDHQHSHELPRKVGTKEDFETWLRTHPHHQSQVFAYEQYLAAALGGRLPPMHELLTTARSWQSCGYEPYEVPPQELWSSMVPTLRLYDELLTLGILPADTQIRSVYRNPELNRCAGGAPSSKHMSNGAIDIWVPSFEMGSSQLYQLQEGLCEYWLYQGLEHNFGLGLYATGAIHLDTQGYRKWGAQFSQSHSLCRYTPPKNSESN